MLETLNASHAVGAQIAGRYVILAEVGRGGSATVYRAHDQEREQVVAIKHLHLPHNLSAKERDTRIQRFQNEARTMAFLNHPHIMAVYDAFQVGHQYYLVAEFLAGMHLKDYVRQFRPSHRHLLYLVSQIVQALDYAHHKNVIHRDIKPENIMIVGHETAKLLDFGIAKFEFSSQVTTDGTLLGTVAYMSPEQLHNSRQTSHQADIYSLGASLYEVLTGQLPFDAESPGAAVVHIFSKAPTWPGALNPAIGPDLGRFLLTCLHKRPQHRYASCAQMLEVIQALLNQVYQTEAQPNAATEALLPRVRQFDQFRVLDMIETLMDKRFKGVCHVWNAFQEVRLYFEQGQLTAIQARERPLSETLLLEDLACWESGNFYCEPLAQVPVQELARLPGFQLLKQSHAARAAYRLLWPDYQDADLPEVLMSPSASDLLSEVEQACLADIDGQLSIGALCQRLPFTRLAILTALKALEDRQFLFIERVRV